MEYIIRTIGTADIMLSGDDLAHESPLELLHFADVMKEYFSKADNEEQLQIIETLKRFEVELAQRTSGFVSLDGLAQEISVVIGHIHDFCVVYRDLYGTK